MSEKLTADAGLVEALKQTPFTKSWDVYLLASADSTMDIAKQVQERGTKHLEQNQLSAGGGDERILIVSLEQTKGRGRNNRQWESQGGQGIYCTYVLKNESVPRNLQGLSLAVGVAVKRTLESFSIQSMLKWPNDVLIGISNQEIRKISGILIEASSLDGRVDQLSIGVGLNLNQETFPRDIPGISMFEILGMKVDYVECLSKLSDNVALVLEGYFSGGFAAFRDEFEQSAYLTDKRVRFRDERSADKRGQGMVLGTTLKGELRIRCDTNEKKDCLLTSGEIEVIDAPSN